MNKESDRLREQANKAARHAAATTDERTSRALRDMEREYRDEADRIDAEERQETVAKEPRQTHRS